MVDVSFEIRGKSVSLEDMDELERQALEVAAHNVASALASVRCAKHGCSPEVVVRGDDVRHLEFRVTGCCAALVNGAMDQLKDAPLQWWQKDPVSKEPWVKD